MSNSYTKTYADNAALTAAELDTAYQTLQLDIANTTLTTTGSTTGQVLTSNGSGIAASFQTVSDPLGPNLIRNYGLAAAASSGTLKVSLKTKAGADPSGTDIVDFTYSTNSALTGTYNSVKVQTAAAITISNSATLGLTSTGSNRVYVYGYFNTVTSSVKLAVSARGNIDDGNTRTTVLMSATSDLATAIYATAALTVAARLLGSVDAAYNSTKAWQSPTHIGIDNYPVPPLTELGRFTAPTVTTVKIGQLAISNSCGSFSTTSSTFVTITNMVINMPTSGKPVIIQIVPDSTGASTIQSVNPGSGSSTIEVTANGTLIGSYVFTNLQLPVMNFIHSPPAGQYQYAAFAKVQSGATEVLLTNCRLMAYEL